MDSPLLTEKQIRGNLAETLARHHVSRAGLLCLKANYRCKTGEIDLICQDNEVIVFIEVRYRQNSDHGNPLETVTRSKQAKVKRAAQYFLQQTYNNCWPACRFDVVGLTGNLDETPDIQWIKHAFY